MINESIPCILKGSSVGKKSENKEKQKPTYKHQKMETEYEQNLRLKNPPLPSLIVRCSFADPWVEDVLS
jgi:Trm5-related predicted tRNA methylase